MLYLICKRYYMKYIVSYASVALHVLNFICGIDVMIDMEKKSWSLVPDIRPGLVLVNMGLVNVSFIVF
jgi:hypothetical protein